MAAAGLRFPPENMKGLLGLHFRPLNKDWKAPKQKAAGED
jgi:hypothetical protein